MIVDVFIVIAIVAFILLVIAYQEASIAWTSLSLLMWIFLMALSFNIEIPYQVAVDIGGGAVNMTTGSHSYFEPALSMVCFGVVIFNIVMLLVDVMDYQNRQKYRL